MSGLKRALGLLLLPADGATAVTGPAVPPREPIGEPFIAIGAAAIEGGVGVDIGTAGGIIVGFMGHQDGGVAD